MLVGWETGVSDEKLAMMGGVLVPDDFTFKQAEVISQMSRWQLYDRIRKGLGPPIKRRGKRVYFPRQEFLDWAQRDVIP